MLWPWLTGSIVTFKHSSGAKAAFSGEARSPGTKVGACARCAQQRVDVYLAAKTNPVQNGAPSGEREGPNGGRCFILDIKDRILMYRIGDCSRLLVVSAPGPYRPVEVYRRAYDAFAFFNYEQRNVARSFAEGALESVTA